jgi:magnesium chelatase subunit D
VVVRPTKKYERIFDAIDSIPTGGKTPLPSALFKLVSIKGIRNAHVRGILITDGKANVPVFGSVEEDLAQICSLIARKGIRLEIYDTRSRAFDPSPSYIEMISEITKAKVHRGF